MDLDRSPSVWRHRQLAIAILAVTGIMLHLVLRFAMGRPDHESVIPLWVVLGLGGVPLTLELAVNLFRREFGSDLLAGISIVTAIILHEYLAGALVVLMLSGGETIERYAVRNASSVLQALARRMPSVAHRKTDSGTADIAVDAIAVGDSLVLFPHETCPVDGTVTEGRSTMDESFLTGEPYVMSKAPGAAVISGATNGEGALTVRADRLPVDSRYAKIMTVMQTSQQHRPRIRRLGDQLGAIYTPIAVTIAVAAWSISGDPIRFLAVLVVATPCPLLIAIPVAIIGAISLAARHSIVVKDPAILERVTRCRTAIFDKTGTLTHGRPRLTEVVPDAAFEQNEVLALAASLERYSKHPLSAPILREARRRGLEPPPATSIREEPGRGLRGNVAGRDVAIRSRGQLIARVPHVASRLPDPTGGLECVVEVDGRYAGTMRFRDEPRAEGRPFIRHLGPKHRFTRTLLLSGDRQSEVRYLAEQVGIDVIHASKSPEEKLAIVQHETRNAETVFVGDGVNDAPAMTAATVGIAFGHDSDITSEAAGAVIMDSSLLKVDELLHIGTRMRRIAMQSAVGGIMLSAAGMLFAAAGYLPPVAGAIFQEAIDVVAVLNALRMAFPTGKLSDFQPPAE